MEQKTQQVACFGKGNVLILDLKESREGFRQRGKGWSFHVKGPKTEKVWEPTEESLVGGIIIIIIIKSFCIELFSGVRKLTALYIFNI